MQPMDMTNGNNDTNGLMGPMSGSMNSSSIRSNNEVISGAPNSGTYGGSSDEFQDEPPLMEELGINLDHIRSKSKAVLLPISRFGPNMDTTAVIQDADLAGPITFALLLGGELLMSGYIRFGYIYGFGLFGCLCMTMILNLLSPKGAVSVWAVASILGYALLPVNLLAGLNVLLRVKHRGSFGMLLAVLVILWCTVASTRLFELGFDMKAQRYLVAYPIALLYSAFVIITIF